MKRTILLGSAVAIALAVTWLVLADTPAAEAERTSTADELREQFVGNWGLVSYELFPADGDPVDQNYVARIVYDDAGNMSAVGMPRDLPERPRTADGAQPQAGFAYFGTWDIDPADNRMMHDVIGTPTHPISWVGTQLVRYYAFVDGNLTLSLRNSDGRTTGTLTWTRLD